VPGGVNESWGRKNPASSEAGAQPIASSSAGTRILASTSSTAEPRQRRSFVWIPLSSSSEHQPPAEINERSSSAASPSSTANQ